LTRKFGVVYHESLNGKLVKHMRDRMSKLAGDENPRGKLLG